MSKAADTIAYEPFGERLDLRDAGPTPMMRGRARVAGIAAFWTVALVLVAARIYFSDPAGSPSEAHSAAIASVPHSVVIR